MNRLYLRRNPVMLPGAMIIITRTFALSFLLVLLSACGDQGEKQSAEPAEAPEASDGAASGGETAAPTASPDPTGTAGGSAKDAMAGGGKDAAAAVAAGASGGSAKALSQVKEAAEFSDRISKTWNSMKGLDFAQKAEFAKKGMDLVSMAKDKIGLLRNIASSLPDGMAEKLMGQVGGLGGNLSDLSGLLGKAGSIASGDWSSYKDQVGSALNLLGGNFSALDSL